MTYERKFLSGGGGGGGAGVSSFNTRTGAVTLAKADVTGTGLAAADVGAAASGSVVTSFNTRQGVVTLSKADVTGTGLAAADVGAPVVGSTLPALSAPTAAAGSSAQAARADHVHPSTIWQPADHGLITWAFDPSGCATAGTLLGTAGTLQVARLHVAQAVSVTNIIVYVTATGATLTSGQNFASLFQGGNLLGSTADQTSAWGASTGVKTMALSGGPFAVTAGDVYVGFYWNGGTAPKFAVGASNQAALINVGLVATSSRWGTTSNTGLTTTPPATLGTIAAAANPWWVALS